MNTNRKILRKGLFAAISASMLTLTIAPAGYAAPTTPGVSVDWKIDSEWGTGYQAC